MANNQQGVCEVRIGQFGAPAEPTCGKPATMRYSAMGGGYMRLCSEHGKKHLAYCERWDGRTWTPVPDVACDVCGGFYPHHTRRRCQGKHTVVVEAESGKDT